MPAPRLRTLVPVLAVLACTESAPTEDTDPVETGDPLAALELEEILEVEGEHMASSEVCYWCHGATTRSQSMRDSLGETVAPWDLWRGTMMANSARDPLFRATLSVEQATFPDRAEAIGQDCMRCHAPAAFAESTLRSSKSRPAACTTCILQTRNAMWSIEMLTISHSGISAFRIC